MKIRTGFVSNSSSSSFVVEIKVSGDERRDWKNLLATFYENLESFSKEGCLKIVEKRLESFKKYNKPPEDLNTSEKDLRHHKYQIEIFEKAIETIERSDKDDFKKLVASYKVNRAAGERWSKNLTDEEINEFSRRIVRDLKAKAVKEAFNANHWALTMTDDNYLCIEVDGPCCYNGWENITMHKDLLELVAFLQFMKYEYKTRVISHEGAF